MNKYRITAKTARPNQKFDSIVLGLAHNAFLDLDLTELKKERAIVNDVKGV
ncbi:UDP-N-acetyl-D-mannosaminuronate dehydrogenase [Flavobacterium sp. PL11]|jgi:UDP-N-acetyl-D-galactosamine dehydrogenase|uniref:hypothetical protein n=1 Tax=Flavobacterium sp. PL11 TaxID=3071717 RepID=UPI002E0BA09F|nr:UDP-N-acetyl-D-mannosaminuronate dehydrogenase [Flavobacterium sp. PL11]